MLKKLLVFWISIMSFQAVSAQTEATFYTNYGDFVVELYDSIKPITAGNFIDLTYAKYFDTTIFHRVISSFVIQGGDPTGLGSGGPGYTIMDEFDSTLSNVQYTLSMANTGAPNSGGSQFFINLVNNTFLDFDNPPLSSAHPVFGKVISGTDVVDAIGVVPTNAADRPIDSVIIDSIRIDYLTTLIAEVELGKPQLSIYPNPITQQSVIAISTARAGEFELLIVDNTGKQCHISNVAVGKGLNRFSLADLATEADLPAGNYLLVMVDDSGYSVSRQFNVPR